MKDKKKPNAVICTIEQMFSHSKPQVLSSVLKCATINLDNFWCLKCRFKFIKTLLDIKDSLLNIEPKECAFHEEQLTWKIILYCLITMTLISDRQKQKK